MQARTLKRIERQGMSLVPGTLFCVGANGERDGERAATDLGARGGAASVRRVPRIHGRNCLAGWITWILVWLGGVSPLLASQSVELFWDQSSSLNIVGNKVYLGTQSGVYTNSLVYPNVSDVVVSGLVPGLTYYFAVSAVNALGYESQLSGEAAYTVPSPTGMTLTVQGATTALQAAALAWTASPDSDVYGYQVEYGTQSGVYTSFAQYYFTTNAVMSGLTPGQTYYFAIAPIDSYGVEAIASQEAAYTVAAPAPIFLQAQTPADSTGVELLWNVDTNEGIDSYQVYYGTESGQYDNSVYAGDVTDFIVHGLTTGTTYYFAVTGSDEYGNQTPYSNEASLAAAPPVPLGGLEAQATNSAIGAVAVSWAASPDSDIYAYQVDYGGQSGVYTNSATFYDATSGIISGLAGGQIYYFAVEPVDDYGAEGIASGDIACAVPVPQPIVLEASPTTNSVQLAWNAVPNEGVTGYYLFYGTASGVYTSSMSCGVVTNAVLPGLVGGQTYYFTVAAMDSYGNQGPLSNEASAVAPLPAPMRLQTQVITDGNGQPYAIEITTPSTVYGAWEMDFSTDLQTWYPYSYGWGPGNGDGYDVDVYASIDPSAPLMFFRVINN